MKIVIASAPATVANVNAGFDILGFSLSGLADQVSVRTIPEKIVRIKKIIGGDDLPLEPDKNTAAVPLLEMIRGERLSHGFEIEIKKGIPLASGLGGSAASAVAAVVAANQLLKKKLDNQKLFYYALLGEAVASGGLHGDNIAPALYGGITACLKDSEGKFQVVPVSCPVKLYCTIFHPQFALETKKARGVLKENILLKDYIQQSMHLTGLLLGLQSGDYDLIKLHTRDVIITPQRKFLMPFYDHFLPDLEKTNSLGFGISGAGPSLFSLSKTKKDAHQIQELLLVLSKKYKIPGEVYVAQVGLARPTITFVKVKA